jgi:hypothetical protein
MTKNKHAVALGKLGRGIKKTLTDEQKEAQRVRLAKARERRWTKKTS